MSIKNIALLTILSGGLLQAYGSASRIELQGDAKKQAQEMISRYKKAKNKRQREKYEQDLREIRAEADRQARVFRQAEDWEFESGGAEVASVNANEAVELTEVVKMIDNAFAQVDQKVVKKSTKKKVRTESASSAHCNQCGY